MNTTRASSLLLLITVVGACVAAPGASGPPTLGAVTTLQVQRTIPEAGITMSPPTTDSAAVQATDALAVCGSTASCPSGAATAELAIVTDTQSTSVDAAGKTTPVMDHKLVWAVSWTNVPCSHSGPGPLPGQSVGPRTTTCDITAFVDANTGAFIYTLSRAHQ